SEQRAIALPLALARAIFPLADFRDLLELSARLQQLRPVGDGADEFAARALRRALRQFRQLLLAITQIPSDLRKLIAIVVVILAGRNECRGRPIAEQTTGAEKRPSQQGNARKRASKPTPAWNVRTVR